MSAQARREQPVEDRRQHDEDRRAKTLADDLVRTHQLQRQCGSGVGRETLEQRGQRKTFEPVHSRGFCSGESVHGGIFPDYRSMLPC
jgi:hypothetical protein